MNTYKYDMNSVVSDSTQRIIHGTRKEAKPFFRTSFASSFKLLDHFQVFFAIIFPHFYFLQFSISNYFVFHFLHVLQFLVPSSLFICVFI